MLAELGAVDVQDVAGGGAEVAGQEALGVAVGDEADVVRVGLLGDGQAAPLGLLADDVLGGVAEREERVGELVGV